MKKRFFAFALMLAVLAAVPAGEASFAPKAFLTVGGGYFSAALDTDGKLWLWGDNETGQLGDGSGEDRFSPVMIMESSSFISVAAGYFHTLAVDGGGGLWVFGDNGHAQLGNGVWGAGHYSLIPERRLENRAFAHVAAGGYHSIAIDTDGGLWTWGLNGFGQIGDGTAGNRRLTPYKVPAETRFVSAAAGNAHSLAIDRDGGLWAWGDNWMGQLGIGSSENRRTVPERVMENTRFASVAAGCYHSMAIDEDGGLWVWGWNSHSQIGDGAEGEYRTLPSKISDGTSFVSAAGGSYHTLAVDANNNLWSWGNNLAGQLGDGRDVLLSGVPTIIKSGFPFASVSAGAWHSLAADAFGGIWAWGSNGYGQLGDSTAIRRPAPVRIRANTLIGDIDGDGTVDAADITLLRRYIAAEDKDAFLRENPRFNLTNADVNGDYIINAADVALLRLWVAGWR